MLCKAKYLNENECPFYFPYKGFQFNTASGKKPQPVSSTKRPGVSWEQKRAEHRRQSVEWMSEGAEEFIFPDPGRKNKIISCYEKISSASHQSLCFSIQNNVTAEAKNSLLSPIPPKQTLLFKKTKNQYCHKAEKDNIVIQ